MKEPTRWREPHGGTDAETRALLSSDAGLVPPADEVNRIWAGLESHLRLAPEPAPTSPVGSATTTGAGALAGKVTVALLLASAAGFGLHRLHVRERPATKAVVALSASASGRAPVEPAAAVVAPEPAAPEPAPPRRASGTRAERGARAKPRESPPIQVAPMPGALEDRRAARTDVGEKPLAPSWGASPWPSPEPATGPVAAPLSPIERPPQEPLLPVNELLEESRQLGRARAALRAHDPDRALVLLEASAFRSTALAQEREALTIEALAAKPALRAQATARARAFLEAYPQSPYRAQIRAIALAGE